MWSGLVCWGERRAASGARAREKENRGPVSLSLLHFLSSASWRLGWGQGFNKFSSLGILSLLPGPLDTLFTCP